jgi:hypothetical protein
LAILTKNTAIYEENKIVTLAFQKISIFSQKIGQNDPKQLKIFDALKATTTIYTNLYLIDNFEVVFVNSGRICSIKLIPDKIQASCELT